MALTDAQESTLRRALGYPARGIETIDRLSGRLTTIDGSADETALQSLIVDYGAVETALDNVRETAGIIQADEVRWSPGGQARDLRAELDRLAAQMARLLALPRHTGRRMGGHTLRG